MCLQAGFRAERLSKATTRTSYSSREKEGEGRNAEQDEDDELSEFCQRLFVSIPKISKWFQTSTSSEGGTEGQRDTWMNKVGIVFPAKPSR